MVHDTPPPQGASTHQIWDSNLKLFKRYVLDTNILQTRSELKVKVTRKWYVTHRNPKWRLQTKFGIPTLDNIRDMLRI